MTSSAPDPRAEPAASFSGRTGSDRGGRGVGAGVVTVIVIGIATALASGGPPSPTPTNPSAGAPSAIALASAPPSPTAGPCDPIDPAGPVPILRLGRLDDPIGVRGLVARTHRPDLDDMNAIGWQVAPLELALEVAAGERVRLVLGTADCLTDLAISAAPVDRMTDATELYSANFNPPAVSFTLDALGAPQGDDVAVRVVARYWTGDSNLYAVVWSEQYFRVRIRSDAEPAATPRITPNVPCVFFAVNGVTARLAVDGARPVYGPTSPANAPTLAVRPGAPVAIVLDGDGCVVAWRIELVDPSTGVAVQVIEDVEAAALDPGDASQNRFPVTPLPTGTWFLHMTSRSTADGSDLEAWWRLEVPATG